jgi:hypothetical protein
MLKLYYAAILAWIMAGYPEDNEHKFSVKTGLCDNLFNFLEQKTAIDRFDNGFYRELQKSFRDAGLEPVYPFDDYAGCEYFRDANNGTLYENPARLSWIVQQNEYVEALTHDADDYQERTEPHITF